MSGPEGPSADHSEGIGRPMADDPDATQTDLPRVARMPAAPSQPAAPGGYARGASPFRAQHEPVEDATAPFQPAPGLRDEPTQQASYAAYAQPPAYEDPRQASAQPSGYAAPSPADDLFRERDDRYDGYGEEAYVAEEPRRHRGGVLAPIAVIALSIIALSAAFLFTRGGGDDQAQSPAPLPTATSTQPSPEPSSEAGSTDVPTSPTPAPWTQTPTPTTSAPSTSTSSSTSSTSKPSERAKLPGGVKTCSPTVGAARSTTCPFAQNVASAVASKGHPRGGFTVNAYSKATKKGYVMHCNGGDVTVCRGGKRAVVYIV